MDTIDYIQFAALVIIVLTMPVLVNLVMSLMG